MKRPGGIKNIAQLLVIGKIEYAILIVNQFPSYTDKLCLTGDNHNNLYLILKKWGNLSKNWVFTSLELVVNFLIRPDKVEELIQLIVNDEEARNVIKTIHWQDTFPFTYHV